MLKILAILYRKLTNINKHAVWDQILNLSSEVICHLGRKLSR